jgi:hypothetical protein
MPVDQAQFHSAKRLIESVPVECDGEGPIARVLVRSGVGGPHRRGAHRPEITTATPRITLKDSVRASSDFTRPTFGEWEESYLFRKIRFLGAVRAVFRSLR